MAMKHKLYLLPVFSEGEQPNVEKALDEASKDGWAVHSLRYADDKIVLLMAKPEEMGNEIDRRGWIGMNRPEGIQVKS